MTSKAGRIGRMLTVLTVIIAFAALAAVPVAAKTMQDIVKAKVFNIGVVPYATDVI